MVIAGLAATRRSEQDLADLAQILDELRRAADEHDPAAFVDADVRFHLRLADAAGNTALRDILGSVQALLRAWISRVLASSDAVVSYDEHVPILAALRAADPTAAEAAMDAHLRSAAGRLEQTLGENAEEAGPERTKGGGTGGD